MVTRTVAPAMRAALESGFFYPVIMVFLDWPDGAVRAHSGAGTISYDGHDWLGVGEFGAISLPEEAEGLAASSASFRLLGVPDDIFARLSDPIRNRDVQVLFGCVTARAGTVLLADPVDIFSGYMDAMQYRATGQGGVTQHGVELTAATGPSARARASVTHSHEDQVAAYPSDTLFLHLINNEAEAQSLTWPES